MARSWILALLALAWSSFARGDEQQPTRRPNVLFVCVDDLNDWIGPLGGFGEVPKTPNFDALAARGVTFTNAHCAAPACNPSRVAVLTGRRPSSSGVYVNDSDWRAVMPDVVTLPMAFQKAGYQVVGLGKVFHAEDQDEEAWDQYVSLPNPLRYVKHHRAGKIAWAGIEGIEDKMPDREQARMGARFLRRKHDEPFFLSVGFKRPHLPWIVPQAFYDLYEADAVPLPPTQEDDLRDVPDAGRAIVEANAKDHAKVLELRAWQPAVHAYLASITFVDAQLGRLLRSLETGPNADDTIVVLWSDHGFHLGEKGHWRKFSLWEDATRVPLFVVVPERFGLAPGGTRIDEAVELTSIYATLAELCDLPLPSEQPLDGASLVPLLAEPRSAREEPALITFRPGNHAVRDERWRYIRYADGSEELYDHETDPHEWTNLARDPRTAEVRASLARWLPETGAQEAPPRWKAKAGEASESDEDD